MTPAKYPRNRCFRPDPRSTDELIDIALSDVDFDDYSCVVQILQYRGSEEVFERARLLCSSDNSSERELGADILGQIGTPGMLHPEEAIKILLSLVKDECSDVIQSAVVSLGFYNSPKIIGTLVAIKKHVEPMVRRDVVFALSQKHYYHNDQSIKTRIELSSDSDRDVREEATASLTYLDPGREDVGQALRSRLDDVDGEIRADALLGLACRHENDAADLLLSELSDAVRNNKVWDDALDAAIELSDPRLIPVLLQLKGIGVESRWLDDAIKACSS